MEDDLDLPSPGDWDGIPENPDGEDVSARWPEWLKDTARSVDFLCNKEQANG